MRASLRARTQHSRAHSREVSDPGVYFGSKFPRTAGFAAVRCLRCLLMKSKLSMVSMDPISCSCGKGNRLDPPGDSRSHKWPITRVNIGDISAIRTLTVMVYEPQLKMQELQATGAEAMILLDETLWIFACIQRAFGASQPYENRKRVRYIIHA